MGVRRNRATAAALTALGLVAAGLVSAGTAAAVPDGYYRTPHSDTVTRVAGREAPPYSAVSFEEWVRAGRPAPRPSPTEYVKYPWSPTVYAVTYWSGPWWQWEQLGLAEWDRAGRPAVRDAGFVEGSTVLRYGTSDELFLASPDGGWHKLTWPEWEATGFSVPEASPDAGWVRRSWSPTVYRVWGMGTPQFRGEAIDLASWVAVGRPTPRVSPVLEGDRFVQPAGSADVLVTGLGLDGVRLTYEQWVAAGSPTPERG